MKIKHGKHTSHSARRPFLLCSSRPKPTVSSLVLQQSISCSLPYLLSTFPVDLTYHFLPRFPPSTLSCISASNFRKHPVLNHRTCLKKKKNKQVGQVGCLQTFSSLSVPWTHSLSFVSFFSRSPPTDAFPPCSYLL